MCLSFDSICLYITVKFMLILKYILIPFKLLLKTLTKHFERPYSFCFLITFFCLICPAILLIVISIQANQLINYKFWYYFTFANLIINFIIVFEIYSLYGVHRLIDERGKFNAKSYFKYIFHYLFIENKIGYIGLYLIAEVIIFTIGWKKIQEQSKDINTIPVIYTFLKISILCNIIFSTSHLLIYLIIFLTLLCKINNSCICALILCKKQKQKSYNFTDYILDCCQFFGLYELDTFENNIINTI